MTTRTISIEAIKKYLIGCLGHSPVVINDLDNNELRSLVHDCEIWDIESYELASAF